MELSGLHYHVGCLECQSIEKGSRTTSKSLKRYLFWVGSRMSIPQLSLFRCTTLLRLTWLKYWIFIVLQFDRLFVRWSSTKLRLSRFTWDSFKQIVYVSKAHNSSKRLKGVHISWNIATIVVVHVSYCDLLSIAIVVHLVCECISLYRERVTLLKVLPLNQV